MIIGVTDYEKQKYSKCSFGSGNSMSYSAINSVLNPGSESQGAGFKEGDVVEVDVNRLTRTVRYIINGVVEALHSHYMLADSSRIFMPFVEMRDKND